MAIFVTGSTGYLGSYLVGGSLREHRDSLKLLVRAKSLRKRASGCGSRCNSILNFPNFREYLNTHADFSRRPHR